MIFFPVGFEALCFQIFFGFDFNGNDLFAVVCQYPVGGISEKSGSFLIG
jgi:hypothetical protein